MSAAQTVIPTTRPDLAITPRAVTQARALGVPLDDVRTIVTHGHVVAHTRDGVVMRGPRRAGGGYVGGRVRVFVGHDGRIEWVKASRPGKGCQSRRAEVLPLSEAIGQPPEPLDALLQRAQRDVTSRPVVAALVVVSVGLAAMGGVGLLIAWGLGVI